MIPPADHVTSILVTWSHRLITWSHRLIMWLPCWSHDPINWPYKTDLPQFTSSLPSPQSLSPSHTHSCLMHPTSTSGHLNWLSRHTRAAVWCVRTWNQNQMLRLNLYNNNPSLSKIIIKAKIHGNAENYKGRTPIITTDIFWFSMCILQVEARYRGGNLMWTVYNLTCEDSNCPNCIRGYLAALLSLHTTAVGRFSAVADSKWDALCLGMPVRQERFSADRNSENRYEFGWKYSLK